MKKQKIEAFNGFTPLEITRLRKKNKENKSLTPLEVFRSGRNYKKNTPLTGANGVYPVRDYKAEKKEQREQISNGVYPH